MAKFHDISITNEVGSILNTHRNALIRKAITTALSEEGVIVPCEIDVLLTDDEGIQELNKTMRQIDKSTDVLSFPAFTLKPGKPPVDFKYADPMSGLTPLGDMAISLEHVRAQAKEYGHSMNRELAYLVVHSCLHLLGYDHMDEGKQKKQMRKREEEIMAILELPQED